MVKHFPVGLSHMVAELGRQFAALGVDAPDFEAAITQLGEKSEEAVTFYEAAVSLLTPIVNDTCFKEAIHVEAEQLTPQEAAERYELQGGVARLKQGAAVDSPGEPHGWCPECFKSGRMQPLQEIKLTEHTIGVPPVLYCPNQLCVFSTSDAIAMLISKEAERFSAPF